MTVNRTTLLDLPLPVTGTESGTWGDTTNNGLTQYLDIAIAGTLVLSTDADVTLTSTEGDSSATNIGATTAQYAILRWTATGSTTRNITALAQSKTYVVINATGGTQSIVLRGAGPTTGVTIISGEKAFCVWNGSDFVKVSSSAAAGGSNTQVQYNSSGVLAGVSGATTNGTAITFSTTNLKLQGSSTGVSSFASANSSATDYTVTFPAASTTIPIATQTLTFSGPTAARTITLPDANFTAARTDAAQTFTGTQTFSSDPVLSGGTANGVLYLNGSKVATSGSALTFDGTLFTSSNTQTGLHSIRVYNGSNAAAGDGAGIQFGVNAANIYGRIWTDNNSAATYFDNLLATPFIWRVSGTSEQMRLTSTGLGIGTSSPLGKLFVNGADTTSTFPAKSSAGIVLNNLNGKSNDRSNTILFGGEQGDTNAAVGISFQYTNITGNGNGALIFGTRSVTTDTAPSERARITSGGYFKASDDGSYNNSAGAYHELKNTANADAVIVQATNASYTSTALSIYVSRNTTNGTFNAIQYYNVGGGAARFLVADSGNVTNTNGTYGTISDAKMKTDIVDAGSQWADIKALRFRKFKMKNDPSGLVQLGVVAQEVELTSPGLVDEHQDRDAEGNDLGTTTKSVKTSVLLMKAAVALQEAMARIETLEAKVAQLEGA